MEALWIGACGAFCATCPVIKEGACKGCKIGYQNGERDIGKAKCKMKVCVVQKGFETCADCEDYLECEIIQGFYAKNGYKYQKYREALEYIRANGYEAFLEIAQNWKSQYGKYE